MVVTRVGDDSDGDISQQFISQLFSNPRALAMTAGILGILGLIPGMPNFIFITSARVLAGCRGSSRSKRRSAVLRQCGGTDGANGSREASWSDVAPLDVLGLEVGYRLIPLVDKAQDGELLRRIRGIRKEIRTGSRLPRGAGTHP